jgi:hypothetical protein
MAGDRQAVGDVWCSLAGKEVQLPGFGIDREDVHAGSNIAFNDIPELTASGSINVKEAAAVVAPIEAVRDGGSGDYFAHLQVRLEPIKSTMAGSAVVRHRARPESTTGIAPSIVHPAGRTRSVIDPRYHPWPRGHGIKQRETLFERQHEIRRPFGQRTNQGANPRRSFGPHAYRGRNDGGVRRRYRPSRAADQWDAEGHSPCPAPTSDTTSAANTWVIADRPDTEFLLANRVPRYGYR